MPDSAGAFKGISVGRLYPGHRDYQSTGGSRKRYRCSIKGCDYTFETSATTFSGGPICPKHDALLIREEPARWRALHCV